MLLRFEDFCRAHGLLVDYCQQDDRIHRCATSMHPRSKNGAYWSDGRRGWCQAWEIGDGVQWWHDPHARPWTEQEKAAWKARQASAQRERQEQAIKAARQAREMVKAASMVIPTPETRHRGYRQAAEAIKAHPYLIAKGFPQEPGLVLRGELLIPMFYAVEYGQIIGLQRIAQDGSKLFLPGMRARGAVHRLGTGKAKEIWLCEGYATALSLREALRRLYRNADVMACFSAGNIEHVASLGIGTHVMADHDASGRGEEAAIRTGLPYAMPRRVGDDANDLHREAGIGAVIELVGRRMT